MRSSGGATPATAERAEFVDSGVGLPPQRRRRWWVIASVVLVLIAAGAVALVSGAFAAAGDSSGSGGNGSATSLATVTRRSLSEQTQFNGTLGYAGSYTVLGSGARHGDVAADGRAGDPPGTGAVPGGRGAGGAAVRADARLPHPGRGGDRWRTWRS